MVVVLLQGHLAFEVEPALLAVCVNALLLNIMLFKSFKGGEIQITIIASIMTTGVLYVCVNVVEKAAAPVTVFRHGFGGRMSTGARYSAASIGRSCSAQA